MRRKVGDVIIELETREGPAAVDDAIRFLRGAQSVPYVHDAAGLTHACRKSVQTMGAIGLEITNTSTTQVPLLIPG